MLTDAQGLHVATDDPRAIAALDGFVQDFLGYGTGAGRIRKGAEADPECVAVQAWTAALYMFLESAEAPTLARPFLDAARHRAHRTTERERMLVEGIGAWIEGDLARALAVHEAIAERWPRDVASLKLGQYHAFNRGDAARLRDLALKALPANAENGFVHGMLAFGQEQCRELEAAERSGRRAVELHEDDPWAHHAVAHVLDVQGRTDEGLAWMDRFAPLWDRCNSFMFTHNWWHAALFRIDRDDLDGALALYDGRIWGRWKEYSQDQAGAVAMLVRLEIRGVDVGDRWSDLAPFLATRTGDAVNGFLCWHYLLGLARAGRDAEVDGLLATMRGHAATAGDRAVWEEIAIPVGEGLVAYARGRWADAADRLGPRMRRLHEAGGSHAQRDLFTQIHLDALERAERWDAALDRWSRRLRQRPTIAHSRRKVEALSATARKSD